MTRYLITLTILTILCNASFAQDLFMPRDVQGAFKKGTRSSDGHPGKNYWQNKARYNITLTATPPDRTVKGTETIVYINNSPDTLKSINFKLFLNIHKPGAPRNGGASPDYLTDGVTVDKFTVNGREGRFPNGPNVFTNAGVALPQPLLPKDSIRISFDWHFPLSLESGREGMIDSTTYFLAYFYPRIAVYDDYNGWDRMPFMDSHEFYSDFNDYDVTINVPANYIVWGTGTLHQPEKLLQPAILKRYTESFTSDAVINVATKADNDAKRVTTQNAMNSWRFTSANIPDAAFGLSDHYVWDAASVVVDKSTNRRASTQAAYNDTAADFHHMASFAKHALGWFSNNMPGVPYPYEKTTGFQGYADMEYPMMFNDSNTPDTTFTKFVAEHEIAHTYMPFYMGINETRYGFMDEGWATTFELLIGRSDMGKQAAEDFYKRFRVRGWVGAKSSDIQVPIVVPGDAMGSTLGFGTNEYGKASLGYLAMMDYLGDDLFKKCLQEFMKRWNGKHPLPWDMFNSFSSAAGQNLNWLWNNWFFSTNYLDFSLEDVKASSGGYTMSVSNTGGFFAPFDAIIKYTDGSSETKHYTPDVWKKDAKQAKLTISTKKKIESVVLDGGIFMDGNPADNNWPKKAF